MEIGKTVHDTITVLRFAGDLDIYAMPSLHDELRSCLEMNGNHVVVNLERVEALYSSGVGALISYSQQLRKQDRRLVLACLSGSVHHVLQLMKLANFFETFESEEAALHALLVD